MKFIDFIAYLYKDMNQENAINVREILNNNK